MAALSSTVAFIDSQVASNPLADIGKHAHKLYDTLKRNHSAKVGKQWCKQICSHVSCDEVTCYEPLPASVQRIIAALVDAREANEAKIEALEANCKARVAAKRGLTFASISKIFSSVPTASPTSPTHSTPATPGIASASATVLDIPVIPADPNTSSGDDWSDEDNKDQEDRENQENQAKDGDDNDCKEDEGGEEDNDELSLCKIQNYLSDMKAEIARIEIECAAAIKGLKYIRSNKTTIAGYIVVCLDDSVDCVRCFSDEEEIHLTWVWCINPVDCYDPSLRGPSLAHCMIAERQVTQLRLPFDIHPPATIVEDGLAAGKKPTVTERVVKPDEGMYKEVLSRAYVPSGGRSLLKDRVGPVKVVVYENPILALNFTVRFITDVLSNRNSLVRNKFVIGAIIDEYDDDKANEYDSKRSALRPSIESLTRLKSIRDLEWLQRLKSAHPELAVMFYGPGDTDPKKIMTKGLNIAYASHTYCHGRALYLASTCDVALQRAYKEVSGELTVIVVFCLPGVVQNTTEQRSLKQPLVADTRLEHWGGTVDPILLVYDTSRIYPAFTITFPNVESVTSVTSVTSVKYVRSYNGIRLENW